MRKMTALILALATLAALLCACSPQAPEIKVEGDLSSIMGEIYKNVSIELPMTGETVIDDSNVAYYLGTTVEYKEALASEAMINAIPFSVCLVRAQEGQDIEKLKSDIKSNVNPNKWICVGVEEKNVVVDNIGDLVILIMADESEALHQAFLKLKEQ